MTLPWYIEIFGWYGMAAFLTAYAGNSYGWLDRSYTYQWINLTGAIAFGFAGIMHGYVQSLTLEAFWAFIAITAMLKLRKEDQKRSE